MVADFKEGQILGELQDLEDEIAAIEAAMFYVTLEKSEKILARVLAKLQREKERLEMRLQQHRQKVKESGIKY